jgi:hypothetical protein
LSQDDDDDDDDEHYSIVTKMSEWCAILDYFEIHLRAKLKKKTPHQCPTSWIVWSGTLQIPYGETHGYLSTFKWKAGAMQYWRNRELTNLSLTNTRNSSLVSISLPFYGLFLGLGRDDCRRLYLQNGVLEQRAHGDNVPNLSARSSLVPADEVYEANPTMALGPRKQHPQRQEGEFLDCYWDSQDGEEGDWEESVAGLGESVIRVMSMMSLTNGVEGRGFEFYLKSAYDNWTIGDSLR